MSSPIFAARASFVLGSSCTCVPRYCTRVTSCFTCVVSCCTRVVLCCVVLNSCCLVLSKTELSLTRLFQYCFLNAEAKPMNVRRLNFHLQPNINVETSLGHQDWINQSLCRRSNNVDKHTSAQLSFSTKCQRWNNVDECWRSTLLQRWCVCWDQLPRTFFTEPIPLSALE